MYRVYSKQARIRTSVLCPIVTVAEAGKAGTVIYDASNCVVVISRPDLACLRVLTLFRQQRSSPTTESRSVCRRDDHDGRQRGSIENLQPVLPAGCSIQACAAPGERPSPHQRSPKDLGTTTAWELESAAGRGLHTTSVHTPSTRMKRHYFTSFVRSWVPARRAKRGQGPAPSATGAELNL